VIIDYTEIEKPIKKIEDILKEFDMEEKSLIIKFITQRHNQTIQKQKASEMLSSHPILGTGMNMIGKHFGKKE